MKAMLLNGVINLEHGGRPLTAASVPVPAPGEKEILIRVSVCGVCHTELDEIEGRTPPPHFPVIPGHQVVGRVEAAGGDAHRFKMGDRVGVAWIYSACGVCRACKEGNENLCENFAATGRDANGGYAEFMVVREDFACAIPALFSDAEAAPHLCAGAIGFRSVRLARLADGQNLGLTGFGASAHLVLKLVRHRYPRVNVFVFARSSQEREFARELGAVWTGEAGDAPPSLMDAVIDTTPIWKPVLDALKVLMPGGRLVINAIRKEDADRHVLQTLDYPSQLWMEKEIKSVANVTRRDVAEFLAVAAEIPITPEVQEYPLDKANEALLDLKARKIRGAKVLRVS